MRKIACCILISLSTVVLAFGTTPPPKQKELTTLSVVQEVQDAAKGAAQDAVRVAANAVQKIRYHFCPAAKKLVKYGQIWSAPPGGWKSYSASFVKTIDSFVGAQWVGVKLGRVICLYRGPKATTFMVSIERDNLMNAPATGKWGKDLGGYRVCRSARIADCPFGAIAAKKKEDLYDVIRGLKK